MVAEGDTAPVESPARGFSGIEPSSLQAGCASSRPCFPQPAGMEGRSAPDDGTPGQPVPGSRNPAK